MVRPARPERSRSALPSRQLSRFRYLRNPDRVFGTHRSPAPGLRDVAEQAVLDLIPLRRARRIVMDVEHEAGFVGELLQLDLPQPDTRSIRAAAIGRDRQLAGFRVALAPHRVEPAAG